MALFKKMGTDNLEENTDFVGGGFTVPSDIYTGTIKMAYVGESKKGAQFLGLEFEHGGKTHKEQVYFTNAKGDNFYEKDGKNYGLPGFYTVNDLCILITGEALEEMDQYVEEKKVNIYDPDEKKELPKSVPVITALLGGEVALAILETLEDKTELQNGEYVPTGKTVKRNNIAKVLHPEAKATVSEITKFLKDNPDGDVSEVEGVFWDKWLEKNKGQCIDKTAGAKGGGKSGKPGSPPQEGGERKKSGLFQKK
jgi:hypothetical protein